MRNPLRALLLAPLLAGLITSAAQARGLIRDAGLEHGLSQLTYPLYSAANLPGRQIPVLIVNDMSLNAFVIDGNAVFVHAGLLLRLKTAAELQAVLAHELAHISNGHMTRRGLNAQTAGLWSKIGLAAAVAIGAATGSGEAAAGIAAGSAGTARNLFFAHTREEETAADRSGMRFLARAGIDPIALADALSLFAGQEDLSPARQDAYLRSHPLSRDRIRAIKEYAEILGPRTTDQEIADYWFARAQAKLSAYLREPDHTFRRYPTSDQSDAGRIARALAHYKLGQSNRAFAELEPILATTPNDAFVHELKGWIALESNRPEIAVEAYRQAAELAPRESQVLSGLGRGLLALNTKEGTEEALEVLQKAKARDRYDLRALRDLAIAYARTGNSGMAALSTAERYALRGDFKSAAIQARRAEGMLPKGSPGWRKAQDIIATAETRSNKRR